MALNGIANYRNLWNFVEIYFLNVTNTNIHIATRKIVIKKTTERELTC